MAETLNLDGERRQAVAETLWSRWREDGRPAAMLIGFSGVGKTERVIAPLTARARAQGLVAVHVDVPAQPMDLERELLARIAEALVDANQAELADRVSAAPTLSLGLQAVLGRGGLVVIDEFQRLLQPRSDVPVEAFAAQLGKLARRTADGGALWLVSNRDIDPVWSEPFHVAVLEAPTETSDATGIVIEAIGVGDAADRLPEARREEVANRFGRNPRALRLLGHLLRFHDIEELIGPPRAAPEGLSQERLANDIERSLLSKAREGLSNAANELLRHLAVLADFAPMPLIQAVGGHLGDVGQLLQGMQQRFLVEQRRGLRQVHPIVREVELLRLPRDGEVYRAANLRAGQWYAAELKKAADLADPDAAIARRLSGARYHLLAADRPDALREALSAIAPFIERRFNLTTRSPSTPMERDAQISILELFLETPGAPPTEYCLARLLRSRADGDDLRRALTHAERASAGQDFSDPWVLQLQLAHLLNGPEDAIQRAPAATEAVSPAKNLYAVYQVYGAALDHAGRTREAVGVCLEGAKRSDNHQFRLLEEALYVAAAAEDDDLLQLVREAAHASLSEPMVALTQVLTLERNGSWKAAAERAKAARRLNPDYLPLAMHETFCWLAEDRPEEAQDALDAFSRGLRRVSRAGVIWLAALVALRCGDPTRGRDLASLYVGSAVPSSPVEIEAMLLREWDTRVATLGEPNPALNFPILPPALSGLPHLVIRPQHGPPVLPPAPDDTADRSTEPTGRLNILAVGTEWSSGQGGLSTFNRQLCCALAEAGAIVTCIAIAPTAAEVAEAREKGVRLLAARETPAVDQKEWLARPPPGLAAEESPDFIIGHGRITGPAALRLQEDHFPLARRLHFVHMAPDEIEWHKLDRDSPAGLRAEVRTQQELDLGHSAYRVVAVGPRLHERYSRDLEPLGGPVPIRFDPGFDVTNPAPRTPLPGPWRVLLMGRMEDAGLKGVDLAARALGLVAESRDKTLPEIEFVIRGARPEDIDTLTKDVRAWAKSPRLQLLVRAYTAEEERLDHDLRTSSLVLMPSRQEGFGLVGLEAIVAGTPLLASSRSGLAQLLQERLTAEQASQVVVETFSNDTGSKAETAEWAEVIRATLHDREAAFRRAAVLREKLEAGHGWRRAVEILLAGL